MNQRNELIMYGGLAIVGYFLYKKYSGVIGSAVDSIAAPIASAYVDFMGSQKPTPQGSVIMPDGSDFPTAELTNLNFGFQGNVAMFTYGGVKYSLSPHDPNGNYVATRV